MKTALFFVAICFSAILVQGQAPAPGPSVCTQTVFEVARENGLTALLDAMTLDDLGASLDNPGGYPLQYTVFAPTNDAINNLLAEEGTTLEALRNTGELDDILQYHFLITPYTEAQLVTLGSTDSNFRNQTLSFGSDGTVLAYNSSATIITPNVPACESIIHVIDNVLIPNFSAVAPGAATAPTTASS